MQKARIESIQRNRKKETSNIAMNEWMKKKMQKQSDDSGSQSLIGCRTDSTHINGQACIKVYQTHW